MKFLISKSSLKILAILIAMQILAAPISYAGGINSLKDKIGSNNNNIADEGGSNTAATVLLVGGLIFGAVLLYKFVLSKEDEDKDSKDDNGAEKKEESASIVKRNIYKLKNDLPFKLKLGFQKANANLPDNSIVMEVSLPF